MVQITLSIIVTERSGAKCCCTVQCSCTVWYCTATVYCALWNSYVHTYVLLYVSTHTSEAVTFLHSLVQCKAEIGGPLAFRVFKDGAQEGILCFGLRRCPHGKKVIAFQCVVKVLGEGHIGMAGNILTVHHWLLPIVQHRVCIHAVETESWHTAAKKETWGEFNLYWHTQNS